MRTSIQGLSWYVRRGLHHEEPGYYYRDALHLPLYGHTAAWPDWADRGAVFIFRCGAAQEFEFLRGDVEPVTPSEPEGAPIVPVFRTYDLDATLERVLGGGAKLVDDRSGPYGRTAYVAVPGGYLDALRQPAGASGNPVDQAALAEHGAGGARVNGIAAMPAEMLDVGWIQLHVADVASEMAFYRDVVGLEVLDDRGGDGALLYMGDLGCLEISPGGRTETPVSDRALAADMWMLRVQDLDGLVADLDRAGVRWINRPFEMTGGVLAYFADPEGHIVGIQTHENDGRVQESEASSRWAAGTYRL